MPDHAQDIEPLRKCAAALNIGKNVTLLTDANVAASNTVVALKAAVETAATTKPAQDAALKRQVLEAIDYAARQNKFTDALLAPLTTVAGLIALLGVTAPSYEQGLHE